MDTPASSENEALRAELAEARHQLDDLRVHFPDALLEGDLATERGGATFGIGIAFRRPHESVSGLLTRADHVLYASKGQSLRSRRRPPPVEPA
jgi:hypothetical protein